METYEHPNGTVYEVKEFTAESNGSIKCDPCCLDHSTDCLVTMTGKFRLIDCQQNIGSNHYLAEIHKNKKSTTTRAEA